MKTLIRQFLTVYCHEFSLVFHDIGLMLFLLFLPTAYPIIYSLIYNPEVVRDIPVVVVDHDRTALSREMTRKLDATEAAWVKGYATDLPEARRAMAERECYAIFEIPEGFARKVGRNEGATAMLYCESSLLLRYRSLMIGASGVTQDMGAEIMAEDINNVAPLLGTISNGNIMPLEYRALGNIQSGFDSFIMPGVLMLILQQAIILAVMMAGGAKRERPELTGYDGVNAQPSVLMTMLGQMMCYITVIAVPMIFLVHYVPLIFSFPVAGNTLEIFAFVIPLVISAVMLGFCLQGIVWERESVFMLWVVTSIIFLFLSGLTWPRYAMSGFWKFVGDLAPSTWGVEGFILMNGNGSSLSQVATDYRMLWLLAGLYSVGAYCVQRWVVRPSIKGHFMAYDKVRNDAF